MGTGRPGQADAMWLGSAGEGTREVDRPTVIAWLVVWPALPGWSPP